MGHVSMAGEDEDGTSGLNAASGPGTARRDSAANASAHAPGRKTMGSAVSIWSGDNMGAISPRRATDVTTHLDLASLQLPRLRERLRWREDGKGRSESHRAYVWL